jgi:MFS transporter, OFA family, oxalate/formate antiporter
MEEKKTMNRWLVVVGALLIQVSLGAIYIYSVFKPSLHERFPEWSNTDLALPSQLVLAFFAISMILAGKIQDKIGPRITSTIGAVLLGTGLVIASYANSLTIFVIGFSIIGGIGIGSAYVCPIATCVKWFPDKRGLISGLAVAGFGAGGLVFTPIAKVLIASHGIMNTFLFLGIIFLVFVLIGSQLMINPPSGYVPKGWEPPKGFSSSGAALKVDFTSTEMIGKYQFWLMWLTYFAGCTAGLMIIMNTTNIWQSFSVLDQISNVLVISSDSWIDIISKASFAVIFVAILNALGRIVWGKVSDRIGRKNTLIFMFLFAGVTMLLLNTLKPFGLFLAGVGVVGFCFGGFLAIYPALTADFFGTKNLGANYGWMFTAYGIGGLFGPWLAPKLMEVVKKVPYERIEGNQIIQYMFDAGNYINSFVISGIMCLIAALLLFILKPPKPS